MTYSDGTDGTIVYTENNAGQFGFTPDLNTALTVKDKAVTVTVGEFSDTFDITVKEKDPGTTPEDPDKPGTEDPGTTPDNPNKPGSTGGNQSGTNGQGAGKGQAVKTGDTANAAVWAGAVVLAAAAAAAVGRKRKSGK